MKVTVKQVRGNYEIEMVDETAEALRLMAQNPVADALRKRRAAELPKRLWIPKRLWGWAK